MSQAPSTRHDEHGTSDAPLVDGFTHWVAYGIPGQATGLSEGGGEAVAGVNSLGNRGYNGPAPPPKNADSLTVQVELEERALPEGQSHEPIAGYLYFPKPDLKKKSSLDLTWYGPAGQVRLVLPSTK